MGCGASSKKNYKAENDISGLHPDLVAKRKSEPSVTPHEKLTVGGGFTIHHKDKSARMWEHFVVDTAAALGQGSYGPVRRVTNQKTEKVRACKILRKEKIQLNEALEEVEVMKILDHPNICRLYEVFEDNLNIYLIMELCLGGSVFDYMADDEGFNEQEASAVMQQMFRCVNYMHNVNVCHRDLKPENMLFLQKGVISSGTLKLIDFGVARRYWKGEVLKTTIGTSHYMAPEVEDGKYNHLCDMWSLGCVMHLMLVGRPPFAKGEGTKLKEKDMAEVTADARDLITRLLTTDFKKRITAQQAVEHPWVKKMAPKGAKAALKGSQLNGLKDFCNQNQLKKGALQVIAQRLSEQEILALKQAFLELDKNQDGVVTYAELREGISGLGIKSMPTDLKEMMGKMDTNGGGTIDYTEFLAATLDTKKTGEEDVCWAAFRAFDLDGSGKICKKELSEVLKSGAGVKDVASPEALARVMQECDGDGDAEIDFDEFMTMMRAK